MDLNADFSKPAFVGYDPDRWVASPMAGVHRLMLDRVGDEVARATTIVRYAPGSQFSNHVHTGGEELLVLEGVFSDRYGDFPKGSYIRNPIGSEHAPWSEKGCIILVKLWQMGPDETQHTRFDDQAARDAGLLYQDKHETVRLLSLNTGQSLDDLSLDGGAEFLCVEGQVTIGEQALGPMGWLRLPDGVEPQSIVAQSESRLWVKSGHLGQHLRVLKLPASVGA